MATIALTYSRPVTRELPGVAERVYVVCVLLLASDAFSALWAADGRVERAMSGMAAMQALWSLIYLVALYMFFRHCQQPLRTIFSEWPLVALCALAMVSVFWSQAPGVTFRHSVALTLTLIFGVYFASRFSLKEQLRLLAWTFWICIIFSFIFGVFGFGSSLAAAQGVQGWYGIYGQKNDLGRMAALSALVFLFWGRAEPRHNGLARLGLATSLLLVALSQSMTAIIAVALVMILLPYFRWTLRRGMLWAAGGISFLIAAGSLFFAWALTHVQEVTGALDKSPTLTGRVQLWILCFVMALRRLWLGYGYGAFWIPGEEPVQRIWRVVHWQPLEAHNGLLELWLGLGLLGTALGVLAFFYYVARAVRFFRHGPDAVAAWPLMFLTFLFLANLTVSEYLMQNSIVFVLYAAAALATRVSKTTPKASLLRAGLVPDSQPERLS